MLRGGRTAPGCGHQPLHGMNRVILILIRDAGRRRERYLRMAATSGFNDAVTRRRQLPAVDRATGGGARMTSVALFRSHRNRVTELNSPG